VHDEAAIRAHPGPSPPAEGSSPWEHEAERHRARGIAFCYRILGDLHLAEDAYQQAWVHVCASKERYEERGRFGAFLYRLMSNVCLNELKRRSRSAAAIVPRPAAAAPHEAADCGERSARVRDALGTLGPRERVAVVLRECEGHSHAEVGRALGLTEGHAAVLVYRTKKKLHRLLTSEGAP
jgi:RNA polymerase sigma-70 factor (ECF subfamily)